MARQFHSNSVAERAARDIDRKRDQERRQMLQALQRQADDLAAALVQRLLDRHIIETTSDRALKDTFTELFHKLPEMEEFDMQFKTAPLRGLVNDPNVISLYLTQYIIEDLIDHPKVQDVFGDDSEIYHAVDSVLERIRPRG
ncbi:MAG: hypothetical protein M0017_11470 [Desulfobacteraceae bacterium]|nr:hypothetical protein [Desulfobacteraceae bacterium]